MSGQLVLITGATGHVGYAVLLEALRKGFNLRVAVRSQAKADIVRKAALSNPFVKESQLSFIIVPDIGASGAFDEAVRGVDSILHIASPVPTPAVKNYEEELIKPAVLSTTSILHSALKEPQVKKVVFTSSVAVHLRANGTGKPFTANDLVEKWDGPYDSPFTAYLASKANAFVATEDFIRQEKPQFGIAKILPGFVIGGNELETTPEGAAGGSNAFALAAPLGKSTEHTPFCVVHLSDVAFLHVAALSTDPKYNGNFGASYRYDAPGQFDDANDYVKKHFPKAVESGLLPANGSTKTVPVTFDTSETERIFNFKFKDFEEQVKDAAGYYIEIAGRSKVG